MDLFVLRSCRLPGVAFECFRSLRQLSLLIWGTVLVPPRGEIEKIAARRQISARGGHNHVSTRYSWLVRGQFDPCGSNGDDSEAWLHHWLLPVAEQTRKLGKLRDFLEIFLIVVFGVRRIIQNGHFMHSWQRTGHALMHQIRKTCKKNAYIRCAAPRR